MLHFLRLFCLFSSRSGTGNAIRAPLGIHRANMHRYWFEDAPSNLTDQLGYLRSVKRLTAAELETFTEGLSIPDGVVSRPLIEQSRAADNHSGFRILDYVKVRANRSGNYWIQCPSCAQQGRDRSMDNLAISIGDTPAGLRKMGGKSFCRARNVGIV